MLWPVKQPWELESERNERRRETALLVKHGMWEWNQGFRQGSFSGPSALGNSGWGILLAVSSTHSGSPHELLAEGSLQTNTKLFLCFCRLLRRFQSTLSRTSSPLQEEFSKVLHRIHSGQWRVGFHIGWIWLLCAGYCAVAEHSTPLLESSLLLAYCQQHAALKVNIWNGMYDRREFFSWAEML